MSDTFSSLTVYPFKQSTGSQIGSGSVVVSKVVKLQFRIMRTNGKIWPAFPSRQGKPDAEGKKKWYSEVWFMDEAIREELNQLLDSSWKKATTGQPDNSTVGEESQAAFDDDLPF